MLGLDKSNIIKLMEEITKLEDRIVNKDKTNRDSDDLLLLTEIFQPKRTVKEFQQISQRFNSQFKGQLV